MLPPLKPLAMKVCRAFVALPGIGQGIRCGYEQYKITARQVGWRYMDISSQSDQAEYILKLRTN